MLSYLKEFNTFSNKPLF